MTNYRVRKLVTALAVLLALGGTATPAVAAPAGHNGASVQGTNCGTNFVNGI